MKRILILGAMGLMFMGCARGLPGSPVRAYYNLCMVERGEQTYCEPWAAVKAHENAPKMGLMLVAPLAF